MVWDMAMLKGQQFLGSGKMLTAIALGGFGIMTAAAACELILPKQPVMAQTATEISGAHPLALALAAAKDDGYVSEGLWQEYIEILHDSAESPSSATVVITQTGFLDDSVQGHQFIANLEKDILGNWRLIDMQKEWICYRGISESGLCL